MFFYFDSVRSRCLASTMSATRVRLEDPSKVSASFKIPFLYVSSEWVTSGFEECKPICKQPVFSSSVSFPAG